VRALSAPVAPGATVTLARPPALPWRNVEVTAFLQDPATLEVAAATAVPVDR
jgi:hypothetical protein